MSPPQGLLPSCRKNGAPCGLEKYRNHPQAKGGREVNSDIAKELFDEYQFDPLARVSAVHEASSIIAAIFFRQQLRKIEPNSPVLLLAGGGGSGKGFTLKNVISEPFPLIFDGVMKSDKGNKELTDLIVEAGHRPRIVAVATPARIAAQQNVRRSIASRRLVPFGPISKGHAGFREAFTGETLKYAAQQGVKVTFLYNGGKEDKDGPREMSADEFRDFVYNKDSDEPGTISVADTIREASYEEFKRGEYEGRTFDARLRDAFDGRPVEAIDTRATSSDRKGDGRDSAADDRRDEEGQRRSSGVSPPNSAAEGETTQNLPDHTELSGSLGIPRSEMPQISSADYAEFEQYLADNGVTITEETAPAADLLPTQNEYNPQQAAQLPAKALTKPLLVSSDNRVLDGHNTLARHKDAGSEAVNIRRLNVPAGKALDLLRGFPKATYKSVDQVGSTEEVGARPKSKDDIFDELLGEQFGKDEVKKAAKKHAKKAAQESKKALDEAGQALKDLFGGNFAAAGGLAFDEATYAKAKPHFEAAFRHFKAAGQNTREALRAIIKYFAEQLKMDAQTIFNMKPYIIQYVEDIEAGTIVLPETVNQGITGETDEQQSETDSTSDNGDQAGNVRADNGLGEAADDQAGSEDAAGDLAERQPGANEGGGQTGNVDSVSETVRDESGSGAGSTSGVDGVGDVRDTSTDGSSFNPAPGNHQIDDELDFRSFSPKKRYRANVDAIRLLKQLETESRDATADERRVLARYVGWGGMPQAFDENNAKWASEYNELRELLTEDEYLKARRSTQDSHYTSKEVVNAIWNGVACR
ncbi:MAG: hypothetical protein ACK4S4_11275 [Pyrinomonadaceae bacterium]